EAAGPRAALSKARADHRRRRARSPDRDVIDTHAHLDALEDAEAAVARARDVGVTRIISIGTDPVSWANTLDLIEAHEDVYGVVGLHPHEATLTFDLAALPRLLRPPKVAGLGETGPSATRRSSGSARSASTTTATTRRVMRRRSSSSTSSASRRRRSCPS